LGGPISIGMASIGTIGAAVGISNTFFASSDASSSDASTGKFMGTSSWI
jgi:hypothetical protein